MAKQVLAILESDACRAQTMPEGVLQVVNADLRQAGPDPGHFQAEVIIRLTGSPLHVKTYAPPCPRRA